MNQAKEIIAKVNLTNSNLRRPILSNIFAGIGLYHALNIEDSYLEACSALIAPSLYIGYKLYKGSFNEKLEKGFNFMKKG